MNVTLGCYGGWATEFGEACSRYLAKVYGTPAQRHDVPALPYAETRIQDTGPLLSHGIHDGVVVTALGRCLQNDANSRENTTQWIVDRYKRLGTAFLDGVGGHYAMAVCDATSRRLLLAADPSGLRTLYYYTPPDDSFLAFGSNLRALAVATGAITTLDRSLEDFFLIYGFLPWQQTPYRGIRAIAPGTVLEWRDGSLTTNSIRPTDDDDRTDLPSGVDEDHIADLLYERLLKCLSEQSSASDDAAVLLGGFDSALVASLLKRMGKRVTTYSFFYEDAQFNQPHTETLSRHLGNEHRWVRIDPNVIAAGLRDYATIFNQPTPWPNYVIQTDHACGLIRSAGHAYCYTGDGCDALFMGYPSVYRRARLIAGPSRLPPFLVHALLRVFGHQTLEVLLGQTYRIALNVLRILARAMPERGHLTFRIFDETSLPRLRNGTPAPPQEAPIEDLLHSLAAGLERLSPLRLAYLGKSAISPNRAKIVGSEDHHGIVIQSPYLHPMLRKMVETFPDYLMRPGTHHDRQDIGKYILAKMALRHRLLPSEVIYQPKLAAIASPMDRWYAHELSDTVNRQLQDLPFTPPRRYLRSLQNDLLAERLYKRYLSKDRVLSHALSLLLTYASFTRQSVSPAEQRYD